ncbi:hypothetical protein BD413DRAFT_612599 [Trametes elegans]|nr:hypothetical protein BD413DRAFT_612599 [Trametes elegans]
MPWLYTFRLCLFMLALSLGLGVVALSVVTLVSWRFVLIEEPGRELDLLYARSEIGAGTFTALSVIWKLIGDSCHRPALVICELLELPVLSRLWIAAAVLASARAGEHFGGSACAHPDLVADDICANVAPIVALSAVAGTILAVYVAVLLCVSRAAARRGTPMWRSPVQRDSASKSVVRDVETKGGGAPVI